MTDPRVIGTLHLIDRKLERIAKALEYFVAQDEEMQKAPPLVPVSDMSDLPDPGVITH